MYEYVRRLTVLIIAEFLYVQTVVDLSVEYHSRRRLISGSSFRTEPEANPLFSVSFHSVLKITHYFQDPKVLNGKNG